MQGKNFLNNNKRLSTTLYSEEIHSDLTVTLYSDVSSDVSSNPVVTLYSDVSSDSLYSDTSSDELYIVVLSIEELSTLYSELLTVRGRRPKCGPLFNTVLSTALDTV